MYFRDYETCLGIPVPKSVRVLVSSPPVCLPARGDHESIEILGDLGRLFHRPRDEIKQAQSLAAGFSDIIILLERPLDRQNHNFDVSFEDFVRACKTLLAVDELIRFSTGGARSIHTVTVLDAFSFQPNNVRTERDKKCHDVLVQILKTKKPKVILRCHRDEYRNEWLKCIEQQGEDYQLVRKEIEITEEHKTVVLQSFHPSCAVNNANCRPEYRALLMYHFVAAFSILRSEFTLPGTAEVVRRLCLIRGERRQQDIPVYEPWQAAIRISQTLGKTYDGPYKSRFCEIVDETPSEHRSEQVEAFNSMYKSLKRLFGNFSTNCGGLAIAKIVLFLWNQHFQDDPLYEQIMSWLLLRGNEQKDWISCETDLTSDQRSLEVQFSSLLVSTRPNLSDIQAINNEVMLLTVEASATLFRGESLGENFRTQMADIFKKHTILIRGYLAQTTLSNIHNAMHIRSLSIQCEIFLSALRNQGGALERAELRSLLRCLKQLASLVQEAGTLYD